MPSDSEKLKLFRKENHYTQTQLAELLGLKQTVISMIENGTRLPSPAFKLAFKNKFQIDWDRESLNDALINAIDLISNVCKGYSVAIPFYSAKVAAGLGAELPDYPEQNVLYFDRRWLNNVVGIKEENAVILQAEGESMDSGLSKPDDIKNGDLLMFDTSVKEIINNKIFIIRLNKRELVVKRVVKEFNGTVLLISNNPAYAVRPLTETDEAEIIGKVVWNGSKGNL